MNVLGRILSSVVLVALGAALMTVVLKGSDLTFAPSEALTPAEFVSIILTALGVMLTAVTVLLGGLAFIGWATFEAKVQQSADAFLEKRFSEEDPRYIALVEDLKRESLKGTRSTFDEENESPYSEDAA